MVPCLDSLVINDWLVKSCDWKSWNCNAQQSWNLLQWLDMRLFYLKQPMHTKISENEKHLLTAGVIYLLFTKQTCTCPANFDCRQTSMKQFAYFSQFPTLESDTNVSFKSLVSVSTHLCEVPSKFSGSLGSWSNTWLLLLNVRYICWRFIFFSSLFGLFYVDSEFFSRFSLCMVSD